MQVPDWDYFSDRGVNITFAHDPSYVRDTEVIQQDISYDDTMMRVTGISLRKGQGEAPFIDIMQTTDPRIVSYLLRQSASSRQVQVGSLEAQVFTSEGMGEPVRYLFEKDGLYIVLSFVFPPSQEDIERTLSSVVLR